MLSYPLTNFEIQKYYPSKEVSNWPKTKDGACVINLDEFKSVGTYWTALYVNGDNAN